MPFNTTVPGSAASMVMARSTQSAEDVHMLLVNSYTPAARTTLSTVSSASAAVSSPTVLTVVVPGGIGGGSGGDGGLQFVLVQISSESYPQPEPQQLQ